MFCFNCACQKVINFYPCPLAQASLRIVAMLQKGELDPAIAMQLLSQGGSVPGKRPLDSIDAGSGEATAGDATAGEESLDDLLHQAKKAKKDPLLNTCKQPCTFFHVSFPCEPATLEAILYCAFVGW